MDGAPVGTITQGGVHNDVGTDCLGVPWLGEGGGGGPMGTITQGSVHNDVGTDCLGIPWLGEGRGWGSSGNHHTLEWDKPCCCLCVWTGAICVWAGGEWGPSGDHVP